MPSSTCTACGHLISLSAGHWVHDEDEGDHAAQADEFSTFLGDLRQRLLEADQKLIGMAQEATDWASSDRLWGKAEGVRLAMSYVDDALRQLDGRVTDAS